MVSLALTVTDVPGPRNWAIEQSSSSKSSRVEVYARDGYATDRNLNASGFVVKRNAAVVARTLCRLPGLTAELIRLGVAVRWSGRSRLSTRRSGTASSLFERDGAGRRAVGGV